MKISNEDARKGKFMTGIFVCGDIMTNELKGNMEQRDKSSPLKLTAEKPTTANLHDFAFPNYPLSFQVHRARFYLEI